MKINPNNVSLKITAGFASQFPREALPQVALSGRSNVGKSSLVNCLINRKNLARGSSTPGKTITVNFYDIDKKLFLVDLPGYGYAKRTYEEKLKWSKLTDSYFTNNESIDLLRLVVQLIDSRTGPTKDDVDMLRFLAESNIPHIIAATKCDKLNATERRAFCEMISANPDCKSCGEIIMFSAKSKEGKDELMSAILSYIK